MQPIKTKRHKQHGVLQYSTLVAEAFSTNSPELYAVWEDFLLDPARQLMSNRIPYELHSREILNRNPITFDEVQGLIPHFGKLSAVFSKSAFRAAKKGALFEARLLQTWHRLIDVFGPLDPRF